MTTSWAYCDAYATAVLNLIRNSF